MTSVEPWYGVRLIFHHSGSLRQAYEERVILVRADSDNEAIAKVELLAKEYEDESTLYTGYAVAFHIFDECGPTLGSGVEVFSLIRFSNLDTDAYLDRFHDTGNECSQRALDGDKT